MFLSLDFILNYEIFIKKRKGYMLFGFIGEIIFFENHFIFLELKT